MRFISFLCMDNPWSSKFTKTVTSSIYASHMKVHDTSRETSYLILQIAPNCNYPICDFISATVFEDIFHCNKNVFVFQFLYTLFRLMSQRILLVLTISNQIRIIQFL